MHRTEIIQYLDGTHPSGERRIALAHQGLIIASGLAISLETVPRLSSDAKTILYYFEIFVLLVFSIEYLVRIYCSENRLRYIFSFWGIVDLLSCLPILYVIETQWAALRALRVLRLVRILKLLHTNRALRRLEAALTVSKGELGVFALLAAIVLYIAGVGIFIFEHEAQPEAFSSIPISLWWAVVSFTTVGYGDIYPITAEGRLFTTAILFIGLGVIAVPTAIITTALINTDLKDKIEDDVEEDIRKDLQKSLGPLRRKPKDKKRD